MGFRRKPNGLVLISTLTTVSAFARTPTRATRPKMMMRAIAEAAAGRGWNNGERTAERGGL